MLLYVFLPIHCAMFNSLPARGDSCHLLITFENRLNPDHYRTSGLIWIQTVSLSDSVLQWKIFF